MFGYNGYGSYMQPMSQRQMMSNSAPILPQAQLGQTQGAVQSQQCIQPFQDVRFVNEKEAEAFIVFPNQKILLINPQNNKMWIKWADAMGQSNTEYYRYEKINMSGDAVSVENGDIAKEQMSAINTEKFALKDDLKNVPTREELNSLKEVIEQLKKQVKISQILSEKPALDIKKEQ